MTFEGRQILMEHKFNGGQPLMEDNIRGTKSFNERRQPSMENFLRWKTPFKQRRPFPESFVGQAVKKRYSSNRQNIDGSKVEISNLINWNLKIFFG